MRLIIEGTDAPLTCSELDVVTQFLSWCSMEDVVRQYEKIHSLAFALDHHALEELLFSLPHDSDVEDYGLSLQSETEIMTRENNLAVRLVNQRNQTLSHILIHMAAWDEEKFPRLLKTLNILQRAYRVESVLALTTTHPNIEADAPKYQSMPFGMGVIDLNGHSVEDVALEFDTLLNWNGKLYGCVQQAFREDQKLLEGLALGHAEALRKAERYEIQAETFRDPSHGRLSKAIKKRL